MVTSRIWFTAAQKAELWERWKNGQSAAAISWALERKNKTGVEWIVVLHGGIGPARRRALAALRFEERELPPQAHRAPTAHYRHALPSLTSRHNEARRIAADIVKLLSA